MRHIISAGILLVTAFSALAQEDSTADILPLPELSECVNATVINKALAPRVFSGYRNLNRPHPFRQFPDPQVSAQVWRDSIYLLDRVKMLVESDSLSSPVDVRPAYGDMAFLNGQVTPEWLHRAMDEYRFQEDFAYSQMIRNPGFIEYAYWDLPERPTLPEEDLSLRGYLKRLDLPEITDRESVPVATEGPRINWLHTVNASLQLSQAFVSQNWYQGGTSYFALLCNFLWDVQLNPVYHPNTMFQSTVSYKLAINSTPDDKFHKYSIAQDLFQYNLKAGYKAYKYWYYSFTTQFKTQFFNSYPLNSQVRTASFLSPGELNIGIGMTFTKENADKSLKFSASISPVAYNLKTCIDPNVDHDLLAFPIDRKVVNEYGSTSEINFFWKFRENATYTTKFFFFTDYKNFQSDWEHTFNFQFSKLFSTQIYVHMRYDTSIDPNLWPGWKRFMLKEILSFGLSYTFSTK